MVARRLLARWRLRHQIGIWFHPDYGGTPRANLGVISLERPAMVLGSLLAEGLVRLADVRFPMPASYTQLQLAHERDYLDAVSMPETVMRIFGLELSNTDVEGLLSFQRLAVGGTIEAAFAVIDGGLRVGFNLSGGLHHAARSRGGGFCLFNDVAVAIKVLREGGYSHPIAIVDLDFHQGDGNLDIFKQDGSVLVYSLHGSRWTEQQTPSCFDKVLPSGTGDHEYLDILKHTLPEALAAHQSRLIFYIAGTDVLAQDQLGDFKLTPQGVLERDRFVLSLAKQRGCGAVVTMAGGYSAGAWHSTANCLRWLLTGTRRVAKSPEARLRDHYARLAKDIDPHKLQEDGGLDLSFDDVLADLHPQPLNRLFLSYYTEQGVEFALERYGLLEKIRQLGFADVRLQVDPKDLSHQTVRIWGSKGDLRDLPLVELVVRRQHIVLPQLDAQEPPSQTEFLVVEWLQLQDPSQQFTGRRPQLPGQKHPGLQLSKQTQEFLRQACHRLGLEGIMVRPGHYHIAVLGASESYFLHPETDGQFRSLRRFLAKYPLSVSTCLVEKGEIKLVGDETYSWKPEEYILPIGERAMTYFTSDAYKQRQDAAFTAWSSRWRIAEAKDTKPHYGAG